MSEVNTETLKDTSDALIVKWVSVGNTSEAHTEKVNCAALVGAVYDLTTDANSDIALSQNGWIPGETVLGASTGVMAQVVAWNYTSNVLSVVHVEAAGGNTAFANGENIIGQQSGSAFLLASQTAPARTMDIESLWFTISEGGSVAVEWEGKNGSNAEYFTAAVLFETGYYGKNALAAIFTPPAANNSWAANGSISVSALGLNANGGYTIVAEFRKGSGFSSIPDARVRDK